MEWIDAKTVYTILHLFGVALGAGGAFVGDVLFLFSTKDRNLDRSEFSLMKRAGAVVWLGLALLFISGVLLFLTNPEGYLVSSKFITKMIIVLIIALNGVLFHRVHLGTLEKLIGQNMASSKLFQEKSWFIYTSGAVSVVSWATALILGGLRMIPITVPVALLVYVGLIAFAAFVADMQRRKYLKNITG